MSFSFGTPTTTASFTLTPTSVGDAKPSTNLFGTPTTTKPGLTLGSTPAGLAKATPAPNFSLGASPSLNFSMTTSAPAPAAAPALNFSSTTAAAPTLNFASGTTSAPTLSFAATTAAPTPSTAVAPTLQFNLGGPASTTPATSFTSLFGTSTAASTASLAATSTPTSLSKLTPSLAAVSTAASASTVPASSLGSSSASTQAATSVTSTTSIASQSTTLTYSQLEDSINKWTIDLEEQGKFFVNQAKQLNAWDNLLISNNDKLVTLNETIERVKQQQKNLDQELDFVLAQQNELDELSKPLEKQLSDIPITDQSRFQMYQLSEVIDSQLKQMSEDLKEIVEHLNEVNKEDDLTDPVSQVSHILNAHMNSLQWIDRNTSQITSHLEQISKLQDVYKNTSNLSM